MTKPKRVQRPRGELKRELVEQLKLLRHACEAYDKGLEAIGRHIALSLRVLLHSHGKSRALLDQLGLRDRRFLDTAGPLEPRNLINAECPLVIMRLYAEGGRYLPKVASREYQNLVLTTLPFVEWWNSPVLRDDRRHTFCRRELVHNVADTDGGAHVDPELDEAYIRLSRENSLGWEFANETENNWSKFERRPELVCMRQIAHEVLSTIYQFVAEFREYAEPVLPPEEDAQGSGTSEGVIARIKIF